MYTFKNVYIQKCVHSQTYIYKCIHSQKHTFIMYTFTDAYNHKRVQIEERSHHYGNEGPTKRRRSWGLIVRNILPKGECRVANVSGCLQDLSKATQYLFLWPQWHVAIVYVILLFDIVSYL